MSANPPPDPAPVFNPRPGVWTPEDAKSYSDGWRDRCDGRVVPPPKKGTPRAEGFYDADVKIMDAARRAMHHARPIRPSESAT